jgi:hypothetical protein
MPEDKKRAPPILQTHGTLEKVRQRTKEVMAGCMKKCHKGCTLNELTRELCIVVARSILLFTPNLKKLQIEGCGAFQHHERDISAWANTLKELPSLSCIHAIHTDFLNLVPFVGGASIQAI